MKGKRSTMGLLQLVHDFQSILKDVQVYSLRVKPPIYCDIYGFEDAVL